VRGPVAERLSSAERLRLATAAETLDACAEPARGVMPMLDQSSDDLLPALCTARLGELAMDHAVLTTPC
jgi:hypothetical protein